MMYKTSELWYAENDTLQSIKLPYENGGFMIVFLPKENVDFNEFISNLSANDFNLDYRHKDVELLLPKFKIEKETDVKKILQSLGIREMFKPGTNDLSPLSEVRVHISLIKQKAIVEIDEEGTVAAAATAVVHRYGAALPDLKQPIKFTADRPFLFFITQGDFIGIYTGIES